MRNLREGIKEIILGLDLGYKYKSSDYAVSREEEDKYKRSGLKEVEDAVDKIIGLWQKKNKI